jgi:hypothetical protein
MRKIFAPKLKDEWFMVPFRELDEATKLTIARDLDADMRRERGNILFMECLLVMLAVVWAMTGGIGKGIVTILLGMVSLGYHLWQRRLRTKWIKKNAQALNWYIVHAEGPLKPTPLYWWMMRKYWPGFMLITLSLAFFFAVEYFDLLSK